MSVYTNTGLVKHAQKALALKTIYMWGGILRPVEQLYDMLKNTYGNKSGTGYSAARWKKLAALKNTNTYGCDCVGLIKSYYWSGKADGGTGSPNYSTRRPFPDVNAGTMFSVATVKGTIDTMPETPGLVVYCKSHPHVGVYIGDGWVIESTLSARGDGVVKTRLGAFGWEYWMQCPYIDYPAAMPEAKPVAGGEIVYSELIAPARVREKPALDSRQLSRLPAGTKVSYVKGTEAKDPKSGYIYVRMANTGKTEKWIVKSAIKG